MNQYGQPEPPGLLPNRRQGRLVRTKQLPARPAIAQAQLFKHFQAARAQPCVLAQSLHGPGHKFAGLDIQRAGVKR